MLKISLAISFCVFISEASFAKDSYLIAINGGKSYEANYNSFETDFEALRNLYPKSQRKILSSEGKDAKFAVVEPSIYNDTVGIVKRILTGGIPYVGTQFSDAIPAHRSNIQSAVSEVALRNPKKVTLVYGNHGMPEGPGILDGFLSNKDIEDHSNRMPASTIVQRIHLHCYSGTMIEVNSKGQKIQDIKRVGDLKSFFKPNRCALTDARGDQISDVDNGITDYLNKNPKANIQDLYNLLSTSVRTGDPILTSVSFIENFARLMCSPENLTEAGVCVDCEKNLFEKCETARKKIFDSSLHYELHAEYEYFYILLDAFIKETIRKKHGTIYLRYVTAQKKYQNYLMCKNIGIMKDVVKSCPEDLEKEYKSITSDLKAYEALGAELFESEALRAEFSKKHEKDLKIDDRDITFSLLFLQDHKSTSKFVNDILEKQKALNQFIPMLAKYPELKKLYESIKNCEQQPVGAI